MPPRALVVSVLPILLLLPLLATSAFGGTNALDDAALVLDARKLELGTTRAEKRQGRRIEKAVAALGRESDTLLRDLRTARKVEGLVGKYTNDDPAIADGLDALAARLFDAVTSEFAIRELWLRHDDAADARRVDQLLRKVDRARSQYDAAVGEIIRGKRLRKLERALRDLDKAESFFFRRAALPLSKTLSSPAARIDDARIAESSGIVHLHDHYWTHNDSGGDPILFRSATPDFREADALVVPGAAHGDWEDLAVFGDDLLVGDIGDNSRTRDDLTLYLVRDAGSALELVSTHPFTYEDGRHDAEALTVFEGEAYVVTKGESAAVYILDVFGVGATNTARRVADLTLPAGIFVTAADVHAPTRSFVLLAYGAVLVFPPGVPSGAPSFTVPLAGLQSEALCFRGETLVITNEQERVFLAPRFIERAAAEALAGKLVVPDR